MGSNWFLDVKTTLKTTKIKRFKSRHNFIFQFNYMSRIRITK
jgi:hypothetical protein